MLPEQPATLSVTLIGPSTPADAWANSLLDRLLPMLQQPRPSPDGLAWWQNSEASGLLTLVDGFLALGQQPVGFEGQSVIDIAVAGQANSNQLEQAARVVLDQGALILTVYSTEPDVESGHWILSNSEVDTAFVSLVVQAAARSVALRAAFIENPGAAAEFVLVEAKALNIPTGTPLSTLATSTATPVRTPTPLSTPTPTREPDPYLGQVIASAIDPIIDSADEFSPGVIADFVNRHPRTGFLSWTDAGPTLNSQTMSVDQASELNFYALAPSDPTGTVSTFLKVVYNGSITRLPERQIYFQGQRMEEILFWLVTHAAERDGQLRIAYDDFGAKQAITVIGFDLK